MEEVGDVIGNFEHNESTKMLGNFLAHTLGTMRDMEMCYWLTWQC